jgi:hypothetical protein
VYTPGQRAKTPVATMSVGMRPSGVSKKSADDNASPVT